MDQFEMCYGVYIYSFVVVQQSCLSLLRYRTHLLILVGWLESVEFDTTLSISTRVGSCHFIMKGCIEGMVDYQYNHTHTHVYTQKTGVESCSLSM